MEKKITQQRKPSIWRSMATFSIHAFPMSQGPSCALTHPADLLWLVGQSHGCAQHRETPRENRGKVLDAGAAIGDPGPQAFSPRISVCWLLTLHYENCGGARKQLFGDGLRMFGRALRGCSHSKYPCASPSFCWNWETQACLSLRSDSSWGSAHRAHGCSHKTPHLDTFNLE